MQSIISKNLCCGDVINVCAWAVALYSALKEEVFSLDLMKIWALLKTYLQWFTALSGTSEVQLQNCSLDWLWAWDKPAERVQHLSWVCFSVWVELGWPDCAMRLNPLSLDRQYTGKYDPRRAGTKPVHLLCKSLVLTWVSVLCCTTLLQQNPNWVLFSVPRR